MKRCVLPMRWLGLLSGLAWLPAVMAAAPTYDFAYRIAGDREARPVQVFDDGRRTFFQFRTGAVVPVMLAGVHGEHVVPAIDGPYHVVDGVPKRFTLVVPGHRASIRAVGLGDEGPADAPTTATAAVADAGTLPRSHAVTPVGIPHGYASPERGDSLVAAMPVRQGESVLSFAANQTRLSAAAVKQLHGIVAASGAHVRFEVTTGTGPVGARRQAAVLQALVARGVAPSRIAVRVADGAVHTQAHAVSLRWRAAGDVVATAQPSSGRPLPNAFDLLLTDRTVARALQRWAARDGYRVDWQAGIHAPVVDETTLEARTVPEAARRVVASLRAAGYPLRLDVVADQVIRVVQTHGP